MSNEVRITVEGQDPAAVRTVVSSLATLFDNNVLIQDQDGQEFEQTDYAVLAQESVQEAGGDDGIQIEDLQITLVEHITFEG